MTGEQVELELEYRRSQEPIPWAPGPISLTDEPDWRAQYDREEEWRGER